MYNSVILLSDVAVSYSENDQVLSNINLNIKNSDFYFVMGSTGSGKSTLLKVMSTMLNSTSGIVKVFGEDLSKCSQVSLSSIRRKIGFIFQDYKILDYMNVFDNIALPLRISGIAENIINDHVLSIIEWVGLNDYIYAYPDILSGGAKQRVAIARSVVSNPSIILADEPTANLDYDTAIGIMRLLKELNKQGTTVILATHSLMLVKQVPDSRILNMHQGSAYLQNRN